VVEKSVPDRSYKDERGFQFNGGANMFKNKRVLVAAAASVFAGSALAAVSADEAKQLGTTLTAWGAEKAGNKDGTIPAYTGERPLLPLADPTRPDKIGDPYANEKPLFAVTAQNMAQYGDKVSEGQKAMLSKYPGYRLDVYPTHRTAIHDQRMLDNTLKNATACKAVDNGLKLEGCYGGITFPIPKTGNEAVWSHMLSHPAYQFDGFVNTWVVNPDGKKILQATYHTFQEAPYLDPALAGKVLPSSTAYWKLRFDAQGPARRIGEKTIIVDSMDPRDPGRRAWSYIPGQRRVKLAPDLAYDTPSPAAGGAATMDEQRVFLGAQDRYDMKLLGKREMFIPYNNNKLLDSQKCPDLVSHTKSFINPDCMRWELHRVWVVEAKLRSGFRHNIPRKVMYFDEDEWSSGLSDNWDAAGKIYHVDVFPMFPYFNQATGQNGGDAGAFYDLSTGIYATTLGIGDPGVGIYAPRSKPIEKNFFSPEALAGEGIR
jgi:hypothetical protein